MPLDDNLMKKNFFNIKTISFLLNKFGSSTSNYLAVYKKQFLLIKMPKNQTFIRMEFKKLAQCLGRRKISLYFIVVIL